MGRHLSLRYGHVITGQQIPRFDSCQLIITWMCNIRLQAPTLTRKCNDSNWFHCGLMSGGRAGGRRVMCLPKFLGWKGNQIFCGMEQPLKRPNKLVRTALPELILITVSWSTWKILNPVKGCKSIRGQLPPMWCLGGEKQYQEKILDVWQYKWKIIEVWRDKCTKIASLLLPSPPEDYRGWHDDSLQASSPGRCSGWVGKGRRACNYVSGLWIPPPIPLSLPIDWAVGFPPISAKRKRVWM